MAPSAPKTAAPKTQNVTLIDPTLILADPQENIRFDYKRSRLDSLKADILEHGGIHTPGEVELLPKETDGKKYKLTVGSYRLRAAEELNKEENAGLLFPAIVRPAGSNVDRVKRQLSENLERESMSPLDSAVAIRKLLDLGVSKSDVRTIFARPGGKKGTEMIPASNAWVNMTVSFLNLPDSVQEKIHLGLIGVAAAYELTKVSPEKQEAVLERAEKAREREMQQEDTDEKNFLESEKKAAEAEQQAEVSKMAALVLSDELKIAQDTLTAKTNEAAEAYKAVTSLPNNTETTVKKQAEEHWHALETDIKAAKKTVTAKQGELNKIQGKVSTALKTAEGIKERLAAARTKPNTPSPAAVTSAKAVKEAAKLAGDGNHVPLTIQDVRTGVKKMKASTFRTVKFLGNALESWVSGVSTDNELIDAIAVFIGDKPQPPVKKQTDQAAQAPAPPAAPKAAPAKPAAAPAK